MSIWSSVRGGKHIMNVQIDSRSVYDTSHTHLRRIHAFSQFIYHVLLSDCVSVFDEINSGIKNYCEDKTQNVFIKFIRAPTKITHTIIIGSNCDELSNFKHIEETSSYSSSLFTAIVV